MAFAARVSLSLGKMAELASKNKGDKVTLFALGVGSLSAAIALDKEAQNRALNEQVLEAGSGADLEIKKKETPRKCMTVDFNNFLPCLTVEDAPQGKSSISYRPVF